MTVKGCRSFAGMVNFLSTFCPQLLKLLKHIYIYIYNLTRKGRHFIWGEEQQLAFEEIKHRLEKLPVLHLPDKEDFTYIQIPVNVLLEVLYIKFRMRKPTLITYASKRVPEAARNYSITEIEMCRLAINIASFAHLSKRVDFNAIVDHVALTHIIKSRA